MRFFRRLDPGLLLLSFLLGGWFFLQGFSESHRVRASRTWPTASGRVVHSAVAERETKLWNGERRFGIVPDVRYVYRVAGQDHLGTAITAGGADGGDKRSRVLVARYPEGATVRVAYDPSEPWRSCLEPGADHNSAARWFVAGVLVCLLGPLQGFLRPSRRRWHAEAEPEILTLGLADSPPGSAGEQGAHGGPGP